ncbi:hypothetical protein E2320_021104, partial [Naja naja]
MGLIQIVKGCVVKILHHCILGCLKNEDQMDFMDENNLIKRLCSQISIPQIVWVIINISDKLDKLYFTRDTLQEITNCIQSIEKSKDPNVLMTKMRKDLPIHVKRMICQEVSDIYYKIMLICSDTQCIEACRECEEDELFAELTLPTDSQWAAYNRGYGEIPLQGYQEREQEECEEDELFAELSLPTDSQWAAYNMGYGENPLQGYQERELEEWWNSLMQDKFPSCSDAQSIQMGGNPQASTSKFPGDDYPSEIEQPLPETHDSEEMEVQDRDSDQFSAEVPRLTESQGIQQSIETNEGPACSEWDVQGEDTEPQASTCNGIHEPACKKPKKGDEEQSPSDTWNDSVSNELDMSDTQTADESAPSEDFDGLNTPEEPSVYLESVQAWQRNLQHYRATEYYEHYRFVNMEYVQSFTRAIDIIHNEVQRLLNRISREISPNDFVQLQLDAEELGRPLFSVRRPMDELNADQFL